MQMSISYGRASGADIEQIYALCKQLIDGYEDAWRIDYDMVLRWVHSKIETHIDEYTTVTVDGERAGYYRFYKNGDGVYEIDDLYILPKFQNRGIGSEIIRRCCASVDEAVMLYVFIKNQRAVSLYERLGFEVVETVNDSRYIMERMGEKNEADM